MHQGGVVATI